MSANPSVPPITTTTANLEPPPLRYVFYVSTSPPGSVQEWRVRSLSLDEQLHAPYELRVWAVPEGEFEDEALLNARVTLEIHRGQVIRRVHGVVLEHVRISGPSAEPIVELRVGPALALLNVHRRSQVIQRTTAPELARMLLEPHLEEHGSRLVLDRLTRSYDPIARCVQRLDTDLAFVQGYLAGAGIALLFHHGAGSESVVLVDDHRGLPPCGCEPLDAGADDAVPWLPIVPRGDLVPSLEGIHTLRRDEETGMELHAETNVLGLRAGTIFELADPPDDRYDETWLVTRVLHRGRAAADGDPAQYDNAIECRPYPSSVLASRPRAASTADEESTARSSEGSRRTVLHAGRTDGQACNELSFEDAAGSEQVFLHAQGDLREHIRRNHRTYVDGDRKALVVGSRMTAINEDEYLTILGDHQETVAGNASQDVEGMLRIRVKGERDGTEPSQALTSPSMVTTVERGTFEVDAADGIVLRCGSSRIELRPDRIVIISPCIVGPMGSLDTGLARGRKTLLD